MIKKLHIIMPLAIIVSIIGIVTGCQKKETIVHPEIFVYLNEKNIGKAITLLDDIENINIKTHYGFSLLHYAVLLNNIELTRILIKKGIDLNIASDDGLTPLHLSAAFNRYQIAKLLLENGADPNIKDNQQEVTPLYTSLDFYNFDISKLILKYDVNINEIFELNDLNYFVAGIRFIDKEKIFQSNKEDTFTEISKIYKHGQPDFLGGTAGPGYETILNYAISKGNDEVVELIINKGANTDFVNRLEARSIHIAAYYSNEFALDLLLQKKANVNDKDNDGDTPLHFASRRENVNIIKKLVNHNANIYALNNDNENVIHIACVYSDNPEVLEYLISLNIDINKRDKYGRPPIYWAIYKEKVRFVEILLKNNVDTTIKVEGKSLLRIAKQVRNKEIFKLLKKAGVK